MAELFSVKENTVTYHIKEIYKTEELEKEGTARKIRVVRKEGNRNVRRTLDYYNLDLIISVGYKLNSKRGVKFRQWATQVLKDYLLKGYVVNQRITALEHQVADLTEKVNFFVRSSLPPVEGIFYDGQIFDAYVQIASLMSHGARPHCVHELILEHPNFQRRKMIRTDPMIHVETSYACAF